MSERKQERDGPLRRRGKIWYFRYTDENGERREERGGTDKMMTIRALAAALEQVEKIRAGLTTRAAIERTEATQAPIETLVAEWHDALLARGADPEYCELAKTRVIRLLDVATIRCVAKLTAGAIQAGLAAILRGGHKTRTVNHYRASARNFCRWLVERELLDRDPVAKTKSYKVTDERQRRALSTDEARRLIEAASIDPQPRETLIGHERAWVYRLALLTGFRRNELREITPDSFRFANDGLAIRLGAAATKNSQEAWLPLSAAIRADLEQWLKGKPKSKSLLPLTRRTSEMIQYDLAKADIPFQTDDGVIDFHSLRVTYITKLAASGISIKAVQQLARHSDPRLTIGVYAKLDRAELRRAADLLAVEFTNSDVNPTKSGPLSGPQEGPWSPLWSPQTDFSSELSCAKHAPTAKKKRPWKTRVSGGGGIRTLGAGNRHTGFRDAPGITGNTRKQGV